MRRKFTVYGLRFSKTTFWNRINTGFLEPAVATALTACGIVTYFIIIKRIFEFNYVATALTACGIVTDHLRYLQWSRYIVATALTACGIVTRARTRHLLLILIVATALTACGIVTLLLLQQITFVPKLQQRLPLAVL